jgi:hypothetical protein
MRPISPPLSTVLRLGYVHNIKGDMFRSPRRFWQNGQEGLLSQIGENERLLPED